LFFIVLSQKSRTPVGNIQIFSNKNIKRSLTDKSSITNPNLKNKKNAREKKMTSEYVKYLPAGVSIST
jgi:hypothetical protein